MNVLAIDQGTSSTKALVIAPDGALLAEAEVTVRPKAVDDGGVEQDPEELWSSVTTAGRDALARAGVAVAAVGLANQGETVLAWDRQSGRPLSPAISWQDRRAATVCDRLKEHGDRLQALTGLPLDPYFAAAKMRWLREQITRAGVCTTTDSWLLHRLTGRYVTDAATASRTSLLDLDRVQWSADACTLFALDADTLPAIVDCTECVGETTAFGRSLPVAGLAVDQQAALFGQGCWDPGDAKCTYGTGAFLLATTGGRPIRSRSGLAACIAWRLGGAPTYCLDGQVYTAGAAVSWLHDLGLIGGPSDLDELAAQADTSGGVVFVPALAGLAAPFWRPAARAVIVGLSLATGRPQLVRALIEGLAAQVTCLAHAVADDLGAPLTRLRVDGGLTRSRVLMQVQADLLQLPVEVYSSPHATAFGIAALTRIGMGAARQRREALAGSPALVYTPNMKPEHAAERLQRWRRVAEATLDLPDREGDRRA